MMQIRGISHFGSGGATLQPTYLWSMGWKEQLAQIKSLGFNAIRVPITPDTLYNTTPVSQLGEFHRTRIPSSSASMDCRCSTSGWRRPIGLGCT